MNAHHTRRTRSRPNTLLVLGIAAGTLALTGCGSRLDHGQFVKAAGTLLSGTGGSTTDNASGDSTSTGSTGSTDSGTETSGGTPAGTTPDGAIPGDASTGAAAGTTTGVTSGSGSSAAPGVQTPAVKSGGAGAVTKGGATKTTGSTTATKGAATKAASGSTTTAGSEPAATTAPGAQTGPILIGSVGDYSGVAGAAEAQGPVGLQVWAAEVNAAGGINGRQVKVIVDDDGSDGGTAASDVQNLVESQHVVAFAANIATYTMTQQENYLGPKGIPVIGGDCSLDIWNTKPNLFTECASVDTTLFMGMKLGAMFGKSKKLGLLYCAEATVCADANAADSDSGKGYAKANGLTIAYSNEFSLTQPDFTQQCLAMQQAGVGLVTVIGDPNAQTRVAASCARQNFSPQFLAGSALVSPALASTTGFSDMIAEMSTLPFSGLNTPAETLFTNSFNTYDQGDPPGPAGSLGWTSGLLLEKALRIAAAQPGGVISSATIMSAMGTIKNEKLGGASVPLTYTAGQPAPDFKCEFLMQVSGGKWTTPQSDTPICR